MIERRRQTIGQRFATAVRFFGFHAGAVAKKDMVHGCMKPCFSLFLSICWVLGSLSANSCLTSLVPKTLIVWYISCRSPFLFGLGHTRLLPDWKFHAWDSKPPRISGFFLFPCFEIVRLSRVVCAVVYGSTCVVLPCPVLVRYRYFSIPILPVVVPRLACIVRWRKVPLLHTPVSLCVLLHRRSSASRESVYQRSFGDSAESFRTRCSFLGMVPVPLTKKLPWYSRYASSGVHAHRWAGGQAVRKLLFLTSGVGD